MSIEGRKYRFWWLDFPTPKICRIFRLFDLERFHNKTSYKGFRNVGFSEVRQIFIKHSCKMLAQRLANDVQDWWNN